MKKRNITMLNIITNIINQFVIIVSGFIIPRIILRTFGSEVNGLVSSLNQFLNYVSIFEGGLAGVVLANLYKPLCNHDDEKISSIIKTTSMFYRKIAIWFCLYSVLLGIIYPIITNTSFSFFYIFSLTIILSLTLFVQYNFSLSQKLLLQADKKLYVVSLIHIVLTIINIVVFVIFSRIIQSIHILKIISAIIFLLQPFIYNLYIKKYYSINKNAKKDNKLLSSRWDGFAINIAAFIHNNTDVTVLTIFTNLKIVSIYTVYGLVNSGLKKIIQSISSGISPTIGHIYAKDDLNRLNEKFDLYEYIIFAVSFLLFTIGGLLITPFVQIYTSKVVDVNYYQPIFGYLIIISELIYCLREPYVNLAYSANKFVDMKKHAYIEASLNIIVSIILVWKFGLIGVSIGTIIAMTYRTIYHVIYLKNNILNRSIIKFVKKLLLFSVTSLIGIMISTIAFPLNNITIINFIKNGLIYSTIISILYFIISLAFFRKELKYFYNMVRKK